MRFQVHLNKLELFYILCFYQGVGHNYTNIGDICPQTLEEVTVRTSVTWTSSLLCCQLFTQAHHSGNFTSDHFGLKIFKIVTYLTFPVAVSRFLVFPLCDHDAI